MLELGVKVTVGLDIIAKSYNKLIKAKVSGPIVNKNVRVYSYTSRVSGSDLIRDLYEIMGIDKRVIIASDVKAYFESIDITKLLIIKCEYIRAVVKCIVESPILINRIYISKKVMSNPSFKEA